MPQRTRPWSSLFSIAGGVGHESRVMRRISNEVGRVLDVQTAKIIMYRVSDDDAGLEERGDVGLDFAEGRRLLKVFRRDTRHTAAIIGDLLLHNNNNNNIDNINNNMKKRERERERERERIRPTTVTSTLCVSFIRMVMKDDDELIWSV